MNDNLRPQIPPKKKKSETPKLSKSEALTQYIRQESKKFGVPMQQWPRFKLYTEEPDSSDSEDSISIYSIEYESDNFDFEEGVYYTREQHPTIVVRKRKLEPVIISSCSSIAAATADSLPSTCE